MKKKFFSFLPDFKRKGGASLRPRSVVQKNTFTKIMKIDSPEGNIKTPISVKPEDIEEAERIEGNTEAMLRLIDYIFFLRDEDGPPS